MGLYARFKEFLKRFLPPPTHAFNREMSSLRKFVQESTERILVEQKQLAAVEQEKFKSLEQQILTLRKIQEDGNKQFDIIRRQSVDAARYASESVWAAVFNNTIAESEWLNNKSFSPGRWAVGYAFLYVMYRVLNETRPKNILELGLGQSTKMISQYIAANTDTEHYVVEKDEDWIRFFCNDFNLTENTKIVCLDYEMIPYKEAEKVRTFKGFKKHFNSKKFNFISIDAPLGGDMKQYARIDILDILPSCIDEEFVIMIDDCERSGERNTVLEIEEKLKDAGIAYKLGKYYGKKDFVLITAEHMGFLTSM